MEPAELMAQLNIQGANIPPPANCQGVREGYGSIYQFEIRPQQNGGAIVYRYDVEMIQVARDKSLTSGGGDDGKKGVLRRVCHELLRTIYTNSNAFGTGGQARYVYDMRKILYTNKQIEPFEREISPDEMTDYSRQYLRSSRIKIEVKPCQTGQHVLDLNNFGPSLQANPAAQADRSLRTFLEMLTSQTFINSDTHNIIGAGRLFEQNIVKKIDDGIVTRNGVAKGVRIIACDGTPKAALVADVKTCAFFEGEANLEAIVWDMVRRRRIPQNQRPDDRFWREFNDLFRGVSGYLNYDPSRIVVIDQVTNRPANELILDVDGQPMSIVQFFEQRKNIRVNPDLPAIRQQNDKETLFPMSTIIILPNQRVGIDKMNEFISRELLNANTIRPHERYQWIESELKNIATGESGNFMREFGVKLVGGKNNVQIGIHNIPRVKFGVGNAVSFQEKINPAIKFVDPSSRLKNWVVGYPRKVHPNDVQRFIGDLVRMGIQRGMRIPQPTFEIVELDQIAQSMEAIIKRAEFFMYIDNKYVKSHSLLKLTEKRYGLLTQHVTLEVAGKARAMTLSNVINKMNMKTFGFNYTPYMDPIAKNKFNIDTGEVLVVGFDTSLPPRASAFEKFMLKKKGMDDLQSEDPMIVGISANYDKNPYKFLGDYFFQPCRQDTLDPQMVTYKMGWLLDRLRNNRNKPPSIIFIIRDGISEGMVQNAVRSEFPSFVEACRRFDQNWKPQFIYCIVDKKHNKRFFLRSQQGGQVENTNPGCVIDQKFTRVDMHEFWLQSHVPLKGTAKIPQYIFPINQPKANNQELQGFILMLCHNWQIVNLAPSLPTPVRHAQELAKRGRNNYVELKRNSPQMIPHKPGTVEIDYPALNNRLCYNGHHLSSTRFNA